MAEEDTTAEGHTTVMSFQEDFDGFIQSLYGSNQKVVHLDRKINEHLGRHLLIQELGEDHVMRILEALETNKDMFRLSVCIDIFNERSAMELGRVINRMSGIDELNLFVRSFTVADAIIMSDIVVAQHVLSQLNPEVSLLKRLRVNCALRISPEFENFIIHSSTLQLVEINLNCNYIEDEAIARLGNALRQSQSIQDLHILETHWPKLVILLEHLNEDNRIKSLDIIRGRVRSDEREEDAMVECMRLVGIQTSLESLCISELPSNFLPLAKAIKVNTSIKTLHMEGAINQAGIVAMGEALEINTTIESVTFPSMRLGSMLPFAQKLGNMKGIKMLFFSGSNLFSEEEAEAIADGLSLNRTIWHLQLSYNARNPQLTQRIRYHLHLNEIGAYQLLAAAPVSLIPRILAASDKRSLAMLYTFINQRADLFYYR